MLVEAMRTRGYGQPLIEKLCFRNWLRVLERTWETEPSRTAAEISIEP